MIIIQNDINQQIKFVDDRTTKGGAVNLQLTHIASNEVTDFNGLTVTDGTITIDASSLRNGLHKTSILNNADLENITSFIIQVKDINPIDLPENPNQFELGYKNN